MAWNDNLWKEMNSMQRRMDRLFGTMLDDRDRGEMLNELSTGYRRAFTNFKETDKEFVMQIEVPGIEKDDIKLNITDKGIEIRAERNQEKETESKEDEDYSYTKSYAGFYQAFDVPDNADLEHIDASYKNGVLTVRLPKKVRAENKKEIKIK